MASIRFTPDQEKKIEKYIQKGQSRDKSDFVRKAVDVYLLQIEHPYNNILLDELSQWIQLKRNVVVPESYVLQCNTSVTQGNTDVTQCSTDVTQDNTHVTQCSTDVTQNNTKTTNQPQKNHNDTLKNKLKKELPMLQRVLNMPENADVVPDYTLKLLSERYNLTKSTIRAWIVENKTWLKEANLENI